MSFKPSNHLKIIFFTAAAAGFVVFAFQKHRSYLSETQFEERSKLEEERKREFLSQLLDQDRQKKDTFEKASLLAQASSTEIKKFIELNSNEALESLTTALLIDCLNGSSLLGHEGRDLLAQKKTELSLSTKTNALTRSLDFMLNQQSTNASGAVLFWERLPQAQSCLILNGFEDVKKWPFNSAIQYSIARAELFPDTLRRLSEILEARASVDEFWKSLNRSFQNNLAQKKKDH